MYIFLFENFPFRSECKKNKLRKLFDNYGFTIFLWYYFPYIALKRIDFQTIFEDVSPSSVRLGFRNSYSRQRLVVLQTKFGVVRSFP